MAGYSASKARYNITENEDGTKHHTVWLKDQEVTLPSGERVLAPLHPKSGVPIWGYDYTGAYSVTEGFAYYLTECCGASSKGSGDGYVVCRKCYDEVEPSLGGLPDREWDGYNEDGTPFDEVPKRTKRRRPVTDSMPTGGFSLTDYNDHFVIVEDVDGECWPGTLAVDKDVCWVYPGTTGRPKFLHEDQIDRIHLSAASV